MSSRNVYYSNIAPNEPNAMWTNGLEEHSYRWKNCRGAQEEWMRRACNSKMPEWESWNSSLATTPSSDVQQIARIKNSRIQLKSFFLLEKNFSQCIEHIFKTQQWQHSQYVFWESWECTSDRCCCQRGACLAKTMERRELPSCPSLSRRKKPIVPQKQSPTHPSSTFFWKKI